MIESATVFAPHWMRRRNRQCKRFAAKPVHDNIHWQPTQGSVQGAQDTLDKKAGNAMDTASLLIALLRASGIPARYVYGSVEVPADQMMNWVGGAKTIDAAQQVLGQGGIPNTAVLSGGKITTVSIEHVWVETLIQYQPGRGAKHVPGQNQTLQPCAEGISAVKAIAIAQQQGQKIYTINRENAATALPKLPVGGDAGAEIRSAVNAGKEVTVHERQINAHGWMGYGYAIIDPDTGAGGYLIEGRGSGGFLDTWSNGLGNAIGFALFVTALLGAFASVAPLLSLILVVISVFVAIMNILSLRLAEAENGCGAGSANAFVATEVLALLISLIPGFGTAAVALGSFAAWLSFLGGNSFSEASKACSKLR